MGFGPGTPAASPYPKASHVDPPPVIYVYNEQGHRGNLPNASLSFISQACSLALALLLLDRK